MWRWNDGAGRYQDVDTGRFLSRASVMGYVEQSIDAAGSVTDLLSNYVSNGQVSPADWLNLMRNEIKGEYIRQYLLGIGGRGQMTQADWGSVGGMIKEQFRWLRDFYAEVAAGSLTPEQIAARARMYLNSAREAYERAHERVATKWGADEEAWQLGMIRTEHCEDCVSFSREGWKPIGYYPIPGDGSGTRCMTNCRCHKEYRNSKTGEEFQG